LGTLVSEQLVLVIKEEALEPHAGAVCELEVSVRVT
jgi:hypothetical protein